MLDKAQSMALIQTATKDTEKTFWKSHALARIRQRGIHVDDVLTSIANGRIIEEYPSDAPFPSVLVLGKSQTGRPLHVVVAVNEVSGEIHIITGYEPDRRLWDETLSRRAPK